MKFQTSNINEKESHRKTPTGGASIVVSRLSRAATTVTAMPCTVGGVSFRSLAALADHARSVLERVDATPDLESTHPREYAFVWAMMHRHPDAPGNLADVSRVSVGETPESASAAGGTTGAKTRSVFVERRASPGVWERFGLMGKCVGASVSRGRGRRRPGDTFALDDARVGPVGERAPMFS